MSPSFNLSKPDRKIHIGVLLPNSTTELLDIAPIDFFTGVSPSMLQTLPPGAMSPDLIAQSIEHEVHWVTEDGKTPAKVTGNMTVQPTDSFEACPPLDILLIGASAGNYTWSESERGFIRESAKTASAVIAICGGFQSVLEAGLLEGKKATAPRFLLPMLKQTVPGTTWLDKRWVQDGNIWTSGALLNGIDLMAAFVRQTWGQGERKELIEWALNTGGWDLGRTEEY